MTILNVENLSKYFGSKDVLSSLSFTLGANDKMAIVGRNGEGKTTLLRIIAGDLESDEGSHTVFGKITVGYLSQDVPDFSSSVLGEVLASHKEAAYLQGKMRELENEMARTGTVAQGYSKVTSRFEAIDGYNLEYRAKTILSGLGFSQEDFDKNAHFLSGGERMRLALGKLLLLEPDLLVLDEPTNHVDLSGIVFLEQFLSNYKGALIFVSHDRYFIDKIAQKVLEIEGGKGKVYEGNYSDYLVQKEMHMRSQHEAYIRQQEYIKRTRAWIMRFKANANLARSAKSREKMLERLETVEKPKNEKRAMGVAFEQGMRSGTDVLSIRRLTKSFPTSQGSRSLFSDFTALLKRGDRVALVGPNGCGKTTMLRCILGLDRDYGGEITLGHNVDVGYFSQGLDDLRGDSTALEEVMGLGLENYDARSFLGRFLFFGDEVDKKVGSLSGGERNRLALCKLVIQRHNFLVLDEPTNHLDMPSREVLESALRDFRGAVLLASHDRFLMDRLVEEMWVFEDGVVKIFKGTYSDYRALLDAGDDVPYENWVKVEKTKDEPEIKTVRPKKQKSYPMADREIDSKIKRLEALEEDIMSLEEKSNELVLSFGDPKAYEKPHNLPWKEHHQVETELELLYDEWGLLSDEIEELQSLKRKEKEN